MPPIRMSLEVPKELREKVRALAKQSGLNSQQYIRAVLGRAAGNNTIFVFEPAPPEQLPLLAAETAPDYGKPPQR